VRWVSLQVKTAGNSTAAASNAAATKPAGVVRTALPNREIECRLHFLGMRCVLRFVLGFGMAIDAGCDRHLFFLSSRFPIRRESPHDGLGSDHPTVAATKSNPWARRGEIKRGQNRGKRWTISGPHVYCSKMGRRCEGTMTEQAERNRPRLPENDRREIAKRIFDALCAKFPEKYVALVQPRGDPTPPIEA
jgi:hypothetical protein